MVNLQAVHHSAEQLGVKAPKAGKGKGKAAGQSATGGRRSDAKPHPSSRFRASRVVLSTTKAASMNKQLPA